MSDECPILVEMVEAKSVSRGPMVLYDETPTPATIQSYPNPRYTPLKEIFKEGDGNAIRTIIDTIRDGRFYERQDGVARDAPKKHCSAIFEISARVSSINQKLKKMEIGFEFEDIIKKPRLIMDIRKSEYGTSKSRKKLVGYIDCTLYRIQREGMFLDEVKDKLVSSLNTKGKKLKNGMIKQGGRIPIYTLPEIALLFNPVTFPYGISILLTAGAAAIKDAHGIGKKYSERETVKKAVKKVQRMKLGNLSSLLIDVGCYSKWKLDNEIDQILEYEDKMSKTLAQRVTKEKVKYLYAKIPLPPKLDSYSMGMYSKYKKLKKNRKLAKELNQKYKELKETLSEMKDGKIECNYEYLREEIGILKEVYRKYKGIGSVTKG